MELVSLDQLVEGVTGCDEYEEEEVKSFLWKHHLGARQNVDYDFLSRLSQRNALLMISQIPTDRHRIYLIINSEVGSYWLICQLIRMIGQKELPYPNSWSLFVRDNPDPRVSFLMPFMLNYHTNRFDLTKLALLEYPFLCQDPATYLSILPKDILRYVLQPLIDSLILKHEWPPS